MERAALLTPDPVRRAQRLLAAARAKREAGELDAALGLLVAVEAGPLDALQAAEVERLRGLIAADQGRGSDAARLLLRAARLLEPLDAALARETYLEALWAATSAGDLGRPGGVREAAEAARAAPPGPDPPRAVDVVLDALALRLTEGYAAAAPALTRALELLVALDAGRPAKPAAGSGSPAREPASPSPWSCGTSSPGMPWPLTRFRSPVTWAPSSSCSSPSATSACTSWSPASWARRSG